MDNKLSELSKPVCTDERPCINCFSGNGPCTVENSTTADMKDPVAYSWVGFPNRKQLSRCEPERWKQPRNIVPLYSQEYVSALLAELEAKDKRIAELEAKTSMTMGVGDGSGSLFVHGDYDSIRAAQRIVLENEELRAKMATPVRLPDVLFIKVSGSAVPVMHAERVKERVQAAGFKCVGDE